MRRGLVALVLLAGSLAGCSEDKKCPPRVATSDTPCQATADCTEAGFATLFCIDGLCRRPCLFDRDCQIQEIEDEAESCKAMAAPQPVSVCEAQLCQTGCPDVPCAAGETCSGGRCVFASHGFEVPPGTDVVELSTLGFDALPRERTNVATRIVFQGNAGCSLGDERCAGPASEGDRFVLIGRPPTQPRGRAVEAPTCRSCACCLECVLDPPPATGGQVMIPNCPNTDTMPLAFMCPANPPAVCSNICAACEQCEAAPAGRIGDNLLTCEATAAARTCPSCAPCDTHVAQCRNSSCGTECAGGTNSPTCTACLRDRCFTEQVCRDCLVCGEWQDCEVTAPGTAECNQRKVACEALGANGCFSTPVAYERSDLTDLEASLVSPAIALSGAEGNIVLELDYVPFGVGLQYRRGVQGQPPETWPVEDQELVIQLCGSACTQEGNWRTAQLRSGEPVSLPPSSLRDNGLLLGSQTSLDWRTGRIVIPIPQELRTGELRFRILPRLDENARVGVDNIVVRRVP